VQRRQDLWSYAPLASSCIHEVGASSALAELKSLVELTLLSEVGEVVCSRLDLYVTLARRFRPR
jgi:hypothetical protein